MKKFISFVMIISLSLMLFSCNKGENNVQITNKDETFLSFNYNGKEIKITKGELYDKLKITYGTDAAINMIDLELMKNTLNSDGVSYYESIKEEDVENALKEEVESSMEEDDTFETAKEKYFETIKVSGYPTYEDYKNFIHLQLAKKEYAKDELLKDIKKQDEKYEEYLKLDNKDDVEEVKPYYTEAALKSRYEGLYAETYFGFIISFNTVKQSDEALLQLGVKTDNAQNSFVHADSNEKLSKNEVAQLFIDLYNNQKAYYDEDYPASSSPLKENVHYVIKDGNIVFNKEKTDGVSLLLNKSNLTGINTSFMDLFLNKLDNYETSDNFYTPTYKTYQNGSKIVYAMKIATIAPKPFEEVKDEIKELIKNDAITNGFIASKINKLRDATNLVIYDDYCEKIYVANNENYKKTNKKLNNVVMKNDYFEVTSDMLFTELEKSFGAIYIADLAFMKAVLSSKYNDIYDFDNNKVINAKKYSDIEAKITSIKTQFEEQYKGFETWENYLLYSYGVSSTLELTSYLVYEASLQTLGEENGKLDENDASSWLEYEKLMNEKVNNYFSLSYYHLIITAFNEKGVQKDLGDFTDYQNKLAKALVDEIWSVDFNSYKGGCQGFFNDLVKAYNKAPVLSNQGHVEVDSEGIHVSESAMVLGLDYTFEGVNISAAKSAGLSFKYETETTYTNETSYVDEFLKIGKDIWDNLDHSIYKEKEYFLKETFDGGDYFTTKYGYHLYVNTKINDLKKYKITSSLNSFLSENIKKDVEYILPTVDMVCEYLISPTNGDLTSGIKSAITTYFIPLQSEKSGTTYAQKVFLNEFKNISFNFDSSFVTNEEFQNVIDDQIEYVNSSLTYFKDEAK